MQTVAPSIDHLLTSMKVDQALQLMQGVDHKLPYHSTFSLLPFLEGLKQQSNWSCNQTSQQIDSFWNQLASFKSQDVEVLRSNETFQSFIQMMMPSMRLNNELNFISKPYVYEPIALTTSAREVFHSGNYDLFFDDRRQSIQAELVRFDSSRLINAQILILNQLYGKEYPSQSSSTFAIKSDDDLFKKYYQATVNHDFVKINLNGDLPELSPNQVEFLYNHLGDISVWEQYISNDLIQFEGFCMVHFVDVTDSENFSRLEAELDNRDFDFTLLEKEAVLAERLRAYFQSGDIEVGFYHLKDELLDVHPCSSLSGLTESELISVMSDSRYTGHYNKMSVAKPYHFAVLDRVSDDVIASKVSQQGFKNLLLYSFYENQEVHGILEIGSKGDTQIFNANSQKNQNLLKTLGDCWVTNQVVFENVITSVMQRHFTSIHPAIEWKFRRETARYFARHQYDSKVEMGEIVFNNLIPLYGQADIINSSNLRNQAIQQDLQLNLSKLVQVLKEWSSEIDLQVLRDYLHKVSELEAMVKENYTAQAESETVELLTNEIHPYLDKIARRYALSNATYEDYLQTLDPYLGIVYDQRKKYESSVTLINVEISTYLDKENQKLQKVLPHYFEKYKTDGVEYNLYVGEELIESGDYHDFDLLEVKMWQLKVMCGITRLVHDLQPGLGIPMKTAQLIFDYASPLSIRFRMDEKRFDVDGTYNVRYEILKKRLDKATIKGTNERLTAADRISIVYLTEGEKISYLDFLASLRRTDVINNEIEELELNPMQGVDGLKALRFSVKL